MIAYGIDEETVVPLRRGGNISEITRTILPV